MTKYNYKDPGLRRRSGNENFLILVVLGFGFLILFSLHNSEKTKDSLAGTEQHIETIIEQEPQGQARQKREPQKIEQAVTEKTPRARIRIEDPMKEDYPAVLITPGEVDLSTGIYGFSPVEFVGPSTSTPLNIQLTQEKPGDIQKAPGYKGKSQWYGTMDLGNLENKRFHFVLDQQPDESFVLYFDKNKNGDLTDDGKPLASQGYSLGGPREFATTIAIPWRTLIKNSPYEGDFHIWFYCTEAGWEENKATHYSRTQLQGKLRIGDHEYMALLIDQGYNDADLTNDGIVIDLNRKGEIYNNQDGEVDQGERAQTEYVIDGKTYTFNVVW